MKTKTIKKLISKKFDELLDSITDEQVRKLVKDNSIVTGGCIASMLLKEKVNDFDIYFTNKETVLAVAKYYVEKFKNIQGNEGVSIWVLDGEEYQNEIERLKAQGIPEHQAEYKGVKGLNLTKDRVKIIINSAGVVKEKGFFNPDDEEETEEAASLAIDILSEEDKKEEKGKYRPVFFSANAISLSNRIQIIVRFYGSPEEIHSTYDFVHCTNYWLSKSKELVLNQNALESLLTKELRYMGSKYPVASVIRTRKFVGRSWTINAGQYLKMCMQISKLDLEDMATLEDQLIGVDVAYFSMLISALKEQKEKDPNFKLDYNYVVAIIDKIF